MDQQTESLWNRLDEFFDARIGFFNNLSNVYEAVEPGRDYSADKRERSKRGTQRSLELAWNWVIDNAPGKTDWLKC